MEQERKIIRLYRKGRSGRPLEGYRALRAEYGLTLIEAAVALGTVPSTIERWEANSNHGPNEEHVRAAFEEYRRDHIDGTHSNMLFTVYPLRVARDMLGMSLDDVARQFGYTPSTWQKFEGNQRILDRKILRELERLVRDNFAMTCRVADQQL